MKLILLDSLSLINRAFYALPPTLTDTKGRIINAVYGYINMLSRILKEFSPTHIAAAFDVKAPTFRHEMYKEYKGTRKPTPPELIEQIPILKEILTAMNIKILEKAGYEADDILGTVSKKFDTDTLIVTGDRDSLQLIDETTRVWLTNHKFKEPIIYDIQKLSEEGLTPSQIIELKSLMGDSSDNIPGIKGVGEGTAKKLLAEYQSLDGVYEHISEIKGKIAEKIADSKSIAYLSKELATINIDVPIEVELSDMELKYPFSQKVKEIFVEMRFKSLFDKFVFADNGSETSDMKTIAPATDVIVTETSELASLVSNLCSKKRFAFTLEYGRVCLAENAETNYTVTLEDSFLSEFTYNNIFEKLKPLFSSGAEMIVFSSKELSHILNNEKIDNNCSFFDLSLASYILDCNLINNNLKELIDNQGLSNSTPAASFYRLFDRFTAELAENDELLKLYRDIEMPVANILFQMEKNGFSVNRKTLTDMSKKFDTEIDSLSAAIYEQAGEKFNINSTKQLSEILFEKLHLPSFKKTKTGLSSSAEVLEGLKDYHPIIPYILRYRQIAKLNSTYCTGLIKLIEEDGKIRTIFKQNYTQTGRLSSTEPNLQNIPVRDEDGKEIRRAFVASSGNILICADYSQIELRLLAHFSADPSLIEAYATGTDIHAKTASLVFNVPIGEVDSSMRRSAKAVNFGIVYGISDYGLSEQIGMPVYKAKEFISKYFEAYPNVRAYMQSNVKFAKENGYIKTLCGRVRRIHEISSSNYNIRSFGERVAMNMPLQGSASDIIKLAMIRVYNRLLTEGLKAKLIMQVHDELIIDTPILEKERVMKIVKYEMENVVKLTVPLEVGTDSGVSWYDCK